MHTTAFPQAHVTCELRVPPPEVTAHRIQTALKLKRANSVECGVTHSMTFGAPDLDMLVMHLKASDMCCEADTAGATFLWCLAFSLPSLQLKYKQATRQRVGTFSAPLGAVLVV